MRWIELADLALKATELRYAHEWAIIDAASALAVFQLKDEMSSVEAIRARSVLESAARKADPDRIRQLLSSLEKVVDGHNSFGELRLKQRLLHENLGEWRRAMRGVGAPRLGERPE